MVIKRNRWNFTLIEHNLDKRDKKLRDERNMAFLEIQIFKVFCSMISEDVFMFKLQKSKWLSNVILNK